MRHDLVAALKPLAQRLHTEYCWVKKAGGNPSRIKAPLTDAKLAAHLNGSGKSYGATPIAPGSNTTMVAVLDLDSHQGETAWTEMQAVALQLIERLEARDLKPIPFRSTGGRGIHIYMLWAEPQDAYSVRVVLGDVLGDVGYRVGTGGVGKKEVEIFPKQDSVPAEGFGSMFVLPLSGASCALDTFELEDLPKDEALKIEWPHSLPVAVVERTHLPSVATASDQSVQLEEVISALAAIPNAGDQELNYEEWRDVIFGIHHVSGGSEEGLRLAEEFSSRSSKSNSSFLSERVWPYISSERENSITGRSILATARKYGWQEDLSDAFNVQQIDASSGVSAVERRLPPFQRNKKGEILALIENVAIGVRHVEVCGAKIALDEFRDEIMYSEGGTEAMRPFRDTDYTVLRIRLAQISFEPVGREMIRDAVHLIARENRFDSAIDWINSLQHDGEHRCERFWIEYCGVADSPYARACGLYFWTALAGRCSVPGTKADMVPVLIGSQGLRKSTAIATIAPDNDYFKTISLAERDTDLSRKMRRCLVAEIDEMRGLGTSDEDAIKSFITRTHEEWTPKYQEYETKFARRLVMVGSANKPELLSDTTGNRRWLPLTVLAKIDTDRIEADRDQLWAEGLQLFKAKGVDWSNAERLAEHVHRQHMIDDEWTNSVLDWLEGSEMENNQPRSTNAFTLSELMSGGLRIELSRQDRRAQMRVGNILRQLGYDKRVVRENSIFRKVWKKTENE